MAKIDEVLVSIIDLKHRLYGEEQDKGDIPAIIRRLDDMNKVNLKQDIEVAILKTKVKALPTWKALITIVVASGASGGGLAGILKAVGVY